MNPSADSRVLLPSAAETGRTTPTFAPLEAHPHDDANLSHELDKNPRYLVLRHFQSRFLPDARDLEVYLPEAYLMDAARSFPVFYLQDGQNLFDGRTSYLPGHTWQAHTTADRLTREGRIQPVILVGINHTGLHRVAEYTPTRDPRLHGGDGDRYGRLLTEEIKPLIDQSFRTLPDAADTALGGSSLGGLISLYLGLCYPKVFSRLALLSPSLWWDNRCFLRLLAGEDVRPPLRIWLDMGTAEGAAHLRDTDRLYQRLVERGWRDELDLRYRRIQGGLHNEDAWAARFDQVLEFLFPAYGTSR